MIFFRFTGDDRTAQGMAKTAPLQSTMLRSAPLFSVKISLQKAGLGSVINRASAQKAGVKRPQFISTPSSCEIETVGQRQAIPDNVFLTIFANRGTPGRSSNSIGRGKSLGMCPLDMISAPLLQSGRHQNLSIPQRSNTALSRPVTASCHRKSAVWRCAKVPSKRQPCNSTAL